MSANEASLDNWINEAIATQLPELRMSLSLEDSELLAKLVREMAQSSNVSIVFSLVDACPTSRENHRRSSRYLFLSQGRTNHHPAVPALAVRELAF